VQAPVGIDPNAVGERAADVNADRPGHRSPLELPRTYALYTPRTRSDVHETGRTRA
jgi:hypothetical protein